MERRPKVPPHSMSPPVGERISKGVPEDNAKMPPTDGIEALPRPASGAERMEELPPSHARFAWHVDFCCFLQCRGPQNDRVPSCGLRSVSFAFAEQAATSRATPHSRRTSETARPSASHGGLLRRLVEGFRKPQARKRNSAPAACDDGCEPVHTNTSVGVQSLQSETEQAT